MAGGTIPGMEVDGDGDLRVATAEIIIKLRGDPRQIRGRRCESFPDEESLVPPPP
jgi:hypothetical protein